MKILIIGSKGFIGSAAIRYFDRNKEMECWGADIVVDYTTQRYILLDTTNSDFNEIFEEHNFDVCINCSGAASVPDSLQHPLRDFTLNTYNVVKILDAIRKHVPECRFINLSSAAIYGNPLRIPIMETDDSNPVSPYGMHKCFAEQLCEEYHRHFGLQCASLRIFSAYGPGLKKQLLWDITQKIKAAAGSIQLFGTGNETRDFIYVEDIVQCIKIILYKGTFDAAVYNVANGIQIKTSDIAATLMKNLDFQGNITFSGESRIGDPLNWQADISKITQLGYTSFYTIEQGINKYVQWLREEKLA